MDSLSAALLTDPYTALHAASAEAVADTAAELRDVIGKVLFDRYPVVTGGADSDPYRDRAALGEELAGKLAPVVARYAHAITGVRTLRALLNAGSLEFSAAGTVKRMSELLERVAALTDEDEELEEIGSRAIDLCIDAKRLLDELQTPDQQPAEAIVAGDVLAGDEAITTAVEAPNVDQAAAAAAAQTASDAAAADRVPTPHFTATRRDGEEHSATVPRSIGRGELQAVLTAARAYGSYSWTIDRSGDGDETVIGRLEADGRYRHADEIERAEATEAFEADADVADVADVAAGAEWARSRDDGAAEAPPNTLPFYQVYMGEGRDTPHVTTPTYSNALSYCRAQSGTPWEIVQTVEGKGGVTVARIAADGTIEEIGELLNQAAAATLDPDPPSQALQEAVHEALKPVLEAVTDLEARHTGVWFTVRRGDDPAGGDFCRSPHYAIALEYCQGSPGVPWAVWQTVNGETGSVIVTTVDEAGDVIEVGERGES